ncbi:MFS transporter [Thermocladium modestius]|uniref:MFS transporter n=1 Tax=Thermocladium modestius TaxID=62609 RepID=A0A830GWY0_9CREN|nr:MFS transporter [Thermocladium modestius]GGP19956.1 MFS transporter [Thermocladium modestius]
MKGFRVASVYFSGNVGVMLLSWLLYGIGSAITNPYLSIYMKMLGASSVMIGAIYSLGMLAQLITIIPGSLLTDTIGRRQSIIIGTWGIAATTSLYVIAPNWQTLLAVYVINSAMAFYQPALMSTVLDSLPSNKRASGVLMVSVLPQLPVVVLPPIGGALIGRYGLLGIRMAYLASTAVSFVVGIIRQRYLKETLTAIKPSPPSPRELLRSYDLRTSTSRLPSEAKFLLVVMFLASIASAPASTLVPVYVIYRLNLSTVAWGTMVAAANAAYLVVGLIMTLYVDRIRRILLIVGAAVMAVANIFGLIPNGLIISLYLVVFQVGLQLLTTSIQSDVGDVVKAEGRGNAVGLLIIFQLIGQSIGSYLAGITYKLNALNLFIMPAIIMVMATAIIVMKRHGLAIPSKSI